jgi:hypothetical protein
MLQHQRATPKKSRLGEKLLRYADTTTLLVKKQKKYVYVLTSKHMKAIVLTGIV